jgi:3-oxoacyl-[acyl-carrier-protein] synthase III
MSRHTIQNVSVRGIAAAVPMRKEGQEDLAKVFGERDAKRLVLGTGIVERRIDHSLTTQDLCGQSAKVLMEECEWSPSTIDHLIFVSQSPDYILPQSACILQAELGLPRSATAFDVRQGCAGAPFGIWLAGRILQKGERALVLLGDVSDRVAPRDRSAVPIFGDGGSAILMEYDEKASPIFCSTGTDGRGYENIIIPAGAGRCPSSSETRELHEDAQGNWRSREHIFMNGQEVFSFALQHVPELARECLDMAGWNIDDCDDVVFHQANEFMIKTIATKVGIPMSKVPLCLSRFGNTSSASIALALVTERKAALGGEKRRYLLLGFGVGWSWAGVALEMDSVVVPDLIEV